MSLQLQIFSMLLNLRSDEVAGARQINVQEHVSTHDRRGRMLSPHWGELRSYPGAAG